MEEYHTRLFKAAVAITTLAALALLAYLCHKGIKCYLASKPASHQKPARVEPDLYKFTTNGLETQESDPSARVQSGVEKPPLIGAIDLPPREKQPRLFERDWD